MLNIQAMRAAGSCSFACKFKSKQIITRHGYGGGMGRDGG